MKTKMKMMMAEMMNKSNFGFTPVAEKLNGRLAMVGFTLGVLTELLTGNGILSQLGF